MNLEPAPRLNRTWFFTVAAVCFAAVVLIGLFAPNKFAAVPLICAVVFLILSIAALMIPQIVEFAANAQDHEQRERERLNEQVQRLQAAGESLARAAAQIKAVEEAVHKTAHAAENLPYRMQEKLAEFNEALAGKEENDREALEQELAELRAANSEQLKTVAEKIRQAATEWSALEAATRQQLKAAEAAAARVHSAASEAAARFETRLAAALASLDGKLAGLDKVPAVALAPLPAGGEAEAASPTPEPAGPGTETVPPAEAAAGTGEDARPKKPRAPRKPKPDGSAPPLGEPMSSGESAFPDSPSEAAAPAMLAEAATTTDGATRLLATAYIGIGNKLFIRGDGPGLSWEKGVPMQFVSIGKWGWATHEAAAHVRCKLYKNDETAAVSGEVVLAPGKHVEITALF